MRRICDLFFMTQGGGVQSLLQPSGQLDQVGRDVCHDDSIRLAASARASGVAVTLTEYADAEHIWILNGSWRMHYPEEFPNEPVRFVDCGVEAPEAITAVEEMVAFVKASCA